MSFSSLKACDLAGVTYRQLDYWIRTGLVEPSVKPAEGSGSAREFSYQDLKRLQVISALLSRGMSLQKARILMSQIQDQHLDGRYVVFDGERVLHLPRKAQLLGEVTGGRCFVVVALDQFADPVETENEGINE